MDIHDYQQKVKLTMNNNLNFYEKLSMLCMGLSGESGELIDMLKKHIYHKHDIDNNSVIKELGDIMWYMANICNELHFDFEKILEINIEKLKKRYPNGFDCEKSINRRD